MGKVVGKKEQKLKYTRQSQKIIWVTAINMEKKIKDKLIRANSFFFPCCMQFRI